MVGGSAFDPRQRLQRLQPGHHRHAHVHQHHVGLDLRDQLDRLLAVAGLGDHLDALGQRQQRADALAHQGLVVDQADTDHGVTPCGTAIRRNGRTERPRTGSVRCRRKPVPAAGFRSAARHRAAPGARACRAGRCRRITVSAPRAIVARLHADHARPRGGRVIQQVVRAGMAHRVGDDFLGAAQQHVGALGIVERSTAPSMSMWISSAGTFSASGSSAAARSIAPLVAQLADRLAHVGQQQLGQRVRLVARAPAPGPRTGGRRLPGSGSAR